LPDKQQDDLLGKLSEQGMKQINVIGEILDSGTGKIFVDA